MKISLIVSDFAKLRGPAPYVINLIGIVSGCSDLTESASGTPMKKLRLHDGRHHVANCVAFGENAEAEGVEDGAEVVLYFVAAKRSRKKM